MLGLGYARAACAAALGIWMGVFGLAQATESAPSLPAPSMRQASANTQAVLRWIHGNRDAWGKPFAVVDKKQARIWVFDPMGRLIDSAPALLGLALGDDSAPDVGKRAASGTIAPHERTTPAGRFLTQPGRNNKGEAIVWVDYVAAVAIHRLRPAPAQEQRPQRLASETPDDNRISLGCVVVSGDFYDRVVAPTLGRQPGVVYILPDTKTMGEVFGPLDAATDL